MLSYNKLKDRPRDFLAATGLTLAEFQKLLPVFPAAYDRQYPYELTRTGTPRQRRVGGGVKGMLSNCEDKLLFILGYQRTNPLQTMHAWQFEGGQPQVHYWMHQLLPVLQHALADLGLASARDASRLATHLLALEGAPATALVGTERRWQRPADAQFHKEQYSGKKRTHTDKHISLANATRGTIVALGSTVAGKTHGKKAADEAKIGYPTNAPLDTDTGLQGDEPERVRTTQPKKAQRPNVERWRPLPEWDCLCGARGGGTRPCWRQTLSHGQRCLAPDHQGGFLIG